MPSIYFEDVEEGEVRELGTFTLSRDEILEFAERYDPQPIHVDEAAAEASIFGGLIASGWQTAAACMRLMVDGFLGDAASMGSPGVEELTWTAPVRPEDEIRVGNEVLDVRPSESRDDRGYVRNRTVGYDEGGEPVVSWVGTNILARREAG